MFWRVGVRRRWRRGKVTTPTCGSGLFLQKLLECSRVAVVAGSPFRNAYNKGGRANSESWRRLRLTRPRGPSKEYFPTKATTAWCQLCETDPVGTVLSGHLGHRRKIIACQNSQPPLVMACLSNGEPPTRKLRSDRPDHPRPEPKPGRRLCVCTNVSTRGGAHVWPGERTNAAPLIPKRCKTGGGSSVTPLPDCVFRWPRPRPSHENPTLCLPQSYLNPSRCYYHPQSMPLPGQVQRL